MNPAKTILRAVVRHSGAALLALVATLLALPVNAAITVPTSPLTTASRVPPNILFILDDSGSMEWDFMPGPFDSRAFNNNGSLATTPVNISYDAYTRNTLAYNPNIDYQPWTQANGNLMTGGTSYTAAYSSDNLASGSTTNLSNNTRTFYVPKANITDEADARQYYRYQIVSTSEIIRSEYGSVVGSDTDASGFPKSGLDANSGNWLRYSFTIPANIETLTVSIFGGSGDADLYVRHNNAPTTGSYDCRPYRSGNNETCTINSPSAGTYHVGIRAYSNFRNLNATAVYSTSNRCGSGGGSSDWVNCTPATPIATRSVASELQNYATWYSYHRTRIKVAKAGAGAAFGELGADVRVGYRTIWNRSNYDIPVYENQGIFADVGSANNRTTWYNRLYAAQGNNGTPLRNALESAGQYFSRSDSGGPYGPEGPSDQLACRQNFTIMTTDGYWNSDSSSVGNQDGSNGSPIARPDGSTYTYVASTPYRDNHSNTLADIAMRYWKSDLRTDLDNIVPITGANPAFWQHMVTFGISIGLQGTVDPNVPGNFNSWPSPTDAEDDHRIDDLLHASINGRGRFVAASNPLSFTQGLKSALAAITERTGSFSNVSANSATLDTGTQLFKASYVSGSWTGELLGYSRNADDSDFEDTPSWRASEGIPTSNRSIFTFDGTAGASFPTSAQIAALDRSGGTQQYQVNGTNNAAYIAGNRSLEIQNGGILRNRNHLLGDIVSSSPVYVADTGTIFVGANDGMLHAFSASTGRELFAYIPNGINWTDLGTLSRPDYGHRYFVDGPLVVSTHSQTPDRNILVGALGKGGKGIFVLDVTNPASFAGTDVKWERTETPGGNMGLVQGKPVIARLNNGVTAVIVGNGINSSTGRAALLIYNLDTGALISELDTGVGSALPDHANSNGLSAPVGWDRDGNGTVDAIYAGDMLGNVWKFNLASISPSSWTIANSGNPLFTAVGPDGVTRQPISGSMTVGMHPTTYKTWVFFGTGRFMTTGDVSNQAVQALYGIIDQSATVTKAELTQRNLVVVGTREGKPVRGFERNAPLPAASKGWYVNLVDSASAPASGERVVTGPQMSGSVLVVSSIIPTADACQPDGRGYINALDAFTGTSAVSPYFDVDGDGDFSNDTLDVGGGQGGYSVPIGSVDMGVGMVTQPTLFSGAGGGGGLACAAGSSGNMDCIGTDEMRNVGRVSWREVIRN